jgi:hypothetical protein
MSAKTPNFGGKRTTFGGGKPYLSLTFHLFPLHG